MSLPSEPHKPTELRLPEPTALEAGEGSQALSEAAAIASGADLSSRRALNEVQALFRRDRADTHVHRVTVCGLWVIGTGAFTRWTMSFSSVAESARRA